MNPVGPIALAIRSTDGVDNLQGHDRTKENNTLVSDTSGMFLKECHPTAGVEKIQQHQNDFRLSRVEGGVKEAEHCVGSAKIFINHPIYPFRN